MSVPLLSANSRPWILGGLLALFTLWINHPVLAHDWAYFDDDINIILNPHLTGGGWDTVKWAWTDIEYIRRFMPLGWLSLDGLFRLGGLDATVFHSASWLLTGLNGVLLFAILRQRMGRPANQAAPETRDICAMIAVSLMVVHPLRAEAVGWASGLLYLGSETLALLACLVSLDFPAGALSTRRHFVSATLFWCSLLVYPVFLSLPVVLMIADFAGSASLGSGKIRLRLATAIHRYWLWVAGTILAGGVNLYAAATAHSGHASLAKVETYTILARLENLLRGVLSYLSRLFWPGNTSVYYGASGPPWPPGWFLALLCLAVIVLFAWRKTRLWTGVSLAVFIIALLPFLQAFDRGQSPSDRYAILLLLCATACLAQALVAVPSRKARILTSVCLLPLTMLSLRPYRQALAVWQDTSTVQARLDTTIGNRPDLKLTITRPAVVLFLTGQFGLSRARLAEGHRLFGENPDLAETERFISDIRRQLGVTDKGDPTVVPYTIMHLEIARTQDTAGHSFAAAVHRTFAARLRPPDTGENTKPTPN